MKKWKKWLLGKLFKVVLFCFIIGVLMMAGAFAYFAKDLPDPTKIGERQIIESTKIFDRTGEILLYDIHGEEKRTIVPFEKIPQHVKDATIVIEDDNFYHHFGIDITGIIRAAIANFRGSRISQGGSTISQQYIKNAFLGGPQAQRTYARKIKEAILTLLLERKYSKDEILGFYLNQVPYGSNAYGIEAASQTYFNKPAEELTLAEATLLAALTQAPSYYSPYGSHTDELKERQEYILERMIKFGYATEEEAQEARETELTYSAPGDLKAHHFVTMIQEYLEKQYSHLYADINSAGLKVYTTIDWDLQRLAEEVVVEGAEKNEKSYRATNAALVAIDPQTGQLLALVGSKDYGEDQFNVATSPYRQPGSSFKPFAYAAAFQKGYTPTTIIYDLETNFGKYGPVGEEKEYIPQNYDMKFRGPVTMRQALAQSLNVPSVKTLYLAGIDETIKLAQSMGITTLKDRKSYGLSLVLGGGEVKLIDETAAYSVFASDGVRHPLKMVLKIEDANGNILEEYKDESEEVLEPQIARQINNILSDEAARAPMMGSHSKLYLSGRPAAAKTGTTQDYSDGWTIGYTPSLVAGVWAGNNEFTDKMAKGAAGLYVAAPMWNEFMTRAYEIKKEKEDLKENEFTLPRKAEEFPSPEEISTDLHPVLKGELNSNKVKIDIRTGQPADSSTPIGFMAEKVNQEAHSILYYVNKDEPQTGAPDYSNDQYTNWEAAALEWARTQGYNQDLPEQNDLSIEITTPDNENIVSQGVNLNITAEAHSISGIKQVDFFFDSQLINSDTSAPYSTSFKPSLTGGLLTQHIIKARAYDNSGNSAENEKTVYVK